MLPKSFCIKKENDLQQVINHLLSELAIPFVLLLDGELGAGKTTFTKYLLSALGSSHKVNSPTFGKIHEYSFAEGTLYHLDLYRELPSPMELEEILLDEQAIFCIEWASRLKEDENLLSLINSLGCVVVQLRFSVLSEKERVIEVNRLI